MGSLKKRLGQLEGRFREQRRQTEHEQERKILLTQILMDGCRRLLQLSTSPEEAAECQRKIAEYEEELAQLQAGRRC